jgi:hypothetical protein
MNGNILVEAAPFPAMERIGVSPRIEVFLVRSVVLRAFVSPLFSAPSVSCTPGGLHPSTASGIVEIKNHSWYRRPPDAVARGRMFLT